MYYGEVVFYRNGYEREYRCRVVQLVEIFFGEEFVDDGFCKIKWVIKCVNENEMGSNKYCYYDVS